MAETTEKQIVKELENIGLNNNGSHPLVPTDELAIAKLVTNKQLIEEERSLQKVETSVEGRYHGIRGYWRIFQVSRVIALLSLYLYLDQLDLHQKHDKKHARHRLENALRLTRMAVYGEKLYAVRVWFFHIFMRALRRVILGKDLDRERIQEK